LCTEQGYFIGDSQNKIQEAGKLANTEITKSRKSFYSVDKKTVFKGIVSPEIQD
jgi:hypothetical protein